MKVFCLLILMSGLAWAQPNFDEAKVGAYVLPDPLRQTDGKPVTGLREWSQLRRPELLALFSQHIYGLAPDKRVNWTVKSSSEQVLGGKAVRMLVTLTLSCEGRNLTLPLLIFRPSKQPARGVFLGLNFGGNQTVHPDPAIPLCQGWVINSRDMAITANRATEESRGGRAGRWPVEAIVDRGYALCTLAYGDLEPDVKEGFGRGVHRFLGDERDDSWGAIAAWAWGLSRVADFLEKEPWAGPLAVVGHSRLGKAALWAGANDERFGLVISNNSGCGGAALFRRNFGETVEKINASFPHWFRRRFHDYNGREAHLPVDQHQLLALMAGRHVYVASAEADLWADPQGERLALEAARPVFELVGGSVGYHCRPGRHDMTLYDWERFLDFAERNWK